MKIYYTSKRFWNTMVLFLIALLGLFSDSALFASIQDVLLLGIAALQLVLLFWFSGEQVVLTNEEVESARTTKKLGRPRGSKNKPK